MLYNAAFWFVCILVMILSLEAIYPLDIDISFMRVFGLFSLFFSLLIASWAKYLYTRHATSYNPDDTPAVLITNSIYGLSRNPIYIALVLAFFGISLILCLSYFILGTLLLFLVLSKWIIPHEEEELRRIFSQAYLHYESTVPKWL